MHDRHAQDRAWFASRQELAAERAALDADMAPLLAAGVAAVGQDEAALLGWLDAHMPPALRERYAILAMMEEIARVFRASGEIRPRVRDDGVLEWRTT